MMVEVLVVQMQIPDSGKQAIILRIGAGFRRQL